MLRVGPDGKAPRSQRGFSGFDPRYPLPSPPKRRKRRTSLVRTRVGCEHRWRLVCDRGQVVWPLASNQKFASSILADRFSDRCCWLSPMEPEPQVRSLLPSSEGIVQWQNAVKSPTTPLARESRRDLPGRTLIATQRRPVRLWLVPLRAEVERLSSAKREDPVRIRTPAVAPG